MSEAHDSSYERRAYPCSYEDCRSRETFITVHYGTNCTLKFTPSCGPWELWTDSPQHLGKPTIALININNDPAAYLLTGSFLAAQCRVNLQAGRRLVHDDVGECMRAANKDAQGPVNSARKRCRESKHSKQARGRLLIRLAGQSASAACVDSARSLRIVYYR